VKEKKDRKEFVEKRLNGDWKEEKGKVTGNDSENELLWGLP